MKAKIQIRLINWIATEATEEQLEGLEELLFYCDIPRAIELIFGKEEYQEFIKAALEEK